MSSPQIILVPVQGQNDSQPLQVGVTRPDQVSQIVQNLQHSQESNGDMNGTKGEHTTNDSSYVKQLTSDPSILYSFINWENPGTTFASFFTIMSLLISTRYFSPFQWTLKIICTILGATSLVEAIGRVTTTDGIMARVRPQTYYRPSDRTYSRLFLEIQEVLDTTLTKAQRIVLAEDLQGTFIGFVSTFAGYWLIQAIPPFWLAVATTLLVYTLGPILTGPHSARYKPVIDNKAQELKEQFVNMASSAGNQAVHKTQELSSRALDTASSASNNAAAKTRDFTDQAIDTASSAGNHTAHKTQELSSRAMNTASSAGNQAVNKTQELSSHAINNASSASNNATAKMHHIQDQSHDLAARATDRTANNTRIGTGTQGAFDSKSAQPNAQGFDDNNLSQDRLMRVQPIVAETKYTPI